MTNLKLITTDKFGDLACNFYRNMNDDILLTREQIGTALEYSNPDSALSMIHKRHKSRLDPLSVVTKLLSADGKEYETILYSQKGVMEICRWSNKPLANAFMDWTWGIVEKYRNGELNNALNLQSLLDTLTVLTQSLSIMQQDINTLKESQQKKSLPEKKYSRWKTNTFHKLNTLLAYVNEHSDEPLKLSEIIHLVIGELEDTYDIDLSDYVSMYKSEYEMDSNPYALDVINHYKDIRDMFTLTLDSILDRLHIITKSEYKSENIFDVLAQQLFKDILRQRENTYVDENFDR